MAVGIEVGLVRHYVAELDAALHPDFAERNVAFLQQADEVGLRDIEDVGRYPGREFSM